jgi:signal peptidase
MGFRRAIVWICRILLSAGLILLAMVLVPQCLGAEVETVISGSMEPSIPTGSMLYVWPVPASELKVGDVISYRLAEGAVTVTHRVVAVDDTGACLTTKGDANQQTDAAVQQEQVIGRVVLVIPCLGFLSVFLRSIQGKMMLIAWMLFLLLTEDLLQKKGAVHAQNGGMK